MRAGFHVPYPDQTWAVSFSADHAGLSGLLFPLGNGFCQTFPSVWLRKSSEAPGSSEQTSTGMRQMPHSQFGSGEVKVGEDQMEKVHVAAQQEWRAGAQGSEMCLGWQAGRGEPHPAGLTLMAHCPQSQAGSSPCWGPSALPKLLVPTNTALSGPSVGMGCFLSCNLSQQGDKCDRLLSKRRRCAQTKIGF